MTGGLSLRQFKPKGFGNNVLADIEKKKILANQRKIIYPPLVLYYLFSVVSKIVVLEWY